MNHRRLLLKPTFLRIITVIIVEKICFVEGNESEQTYDTAITLLKKILFRLGCVDVEESKKGDDINTKKVKVRVVFE